MEGRELIKDISEPCTIIQEYLSKNVDPYVEISISADDVKVKRIIAYAPKEGQSAYIADCRKD